jgi:hypothetical protein
MQLRRLFLVFTLAVLTTASLAAQSLTAGPEIRLSAGGFEWLHELPPSLAAQADGNFLNGWQDGAGLRVRAVPSAGAPLAARQLMPAGADDPSPPSLAALGSRRYVAVWRLLRSITFDDIDLQILARFLDDSGNPIGDPLVLVDAEASHGSWPSSVAVAAEPAGGFVIAWTQVDGVRARRFDAQGAPAGPEVAVSGSGANPSVAALPGGGFAVVWGDESGEGAGFLRLFGSGGLPATAATLLAEPLGTFGFDPFLSADSAGRFVVAWSEFQVSATSTESTWWVRARRFGPDGQPLAPAFVVTETREPRAYNVGDVSVRPEGSFLILFVEADSNRGSAGLPFDQSPVDADTLARAYGAGGDPLGPAFLIHDSADGDQHPGGADATPEGWAVNWARRLDAGTGVYARRLTLSCGTGNTLCLNNGRFRAEVRWRTSPTGPEGEGRPLGLTGDTGAFWFFDPANLELVVKVLDGTGLNDHFWVFYGSLSNVAYELTITDAVTGLQRTYTNPAGTLASRADTLAFPSGYPQPASPAASLLDARGLPLAADAGCGTGPALCLNDGRFRVEAAWRVPATGASGQGQPVGVTGDTGAFWFFDPANLELVVKVLDGTAINGRFWVFFGSLTNVEFDLTVTDTLTGVQRIYHNPAGTMASRADTQAF